MTQEEADKLIEELPETRQLRWCESKECWCVGCANKSGYLQQKGVTGDQWLDWIQRQNKAPF